MKMQEDEPLGGISIADTEAAKSLFQGPLIAESMLEFAKFSNVFSLSDPELGGRSGGASESISLVKGTNYPPIATGLSSSLLELQDGRWGLEVSNSKTRMTGVELLPESFNREKLQEGIPEHVRMAETAYINAYNNSNPLSIRPLIADGKKFINREGSDGQPFMPPRRPLEQFEIAETHEKIRATFVQNGNDRFTVITQIKNRNGCIGLEAETFSYSQSSGRIERTRRKNPDSGQIELPLEHKLVGKLLSKDGSVPILADALGDKELRAQMMDIIRSTPR